MSTATIRELARRFSAEQLEACMTAEIETGTNLCVQDGTVQEVVSVLAEAEFVREQVDRGVPRADAIRDLARRMRAVHEAETPHGC